MKISYYKAVWFDAFWTLVTQSNKFDRYLLKIVLKYWWDIKKAKLLTTKNPENIEWYMVSVLTLCWLDISKIKGSELKTLIELYNSDLKNFKLRDNTIETLELTREKVDKVFLISNLSSLYIPVIKKLWLEQYFNFILYSCQEWVKKNIHSDEIFKKAHSKLEWINKSEVIYTWDRKSNDEIAPQNAWFDSINIEKFKKIILNNESN